MSKPGVAAIGVAKPICNCHLHRTWFTQMSIKRDYLSRRELVVSADLIYIFTFMLNVVVAIINGVRLN